MTGDIPYSSKIDRHSAGRIMEVTITLMLIVIVSGCAASKPLWDLPTATEATESQGTNEETRALESSAFELERLDRLLAKATFALSEQRLTTPEDDNAYLYYLQVIASDPENAEAQSGINKIIETYVSWAFDEANAGNYANATTYARRARSIEPDDPNVEAVFNFITTRQQKETFRFVLDAKAVTQRTTSAIDFPGIAAKITRGTFVTIQAFDDASGRWIYQALSKLLDVRMEAELVIGSPAKITLSR